MYSVRKILDLAAGYRRSLISCSICCIHKKNNSYQTAIVYCSRIHEI